MKKISSILLSAVLVLSLLAGCASDPKAALMKAVEKNNTLTSYESNMDIKMKVETAGVTMDMPITGNVKVAQKDGKMVMSTDMNMETMGVKMAIKIYMADNFMYMDILNQKMKMEVPMDELQNAEKSLGGLDQDVIKEVKTESADGGTKYTVTVDETKMKDFAEAILAKSQVGTGGSAAAGLQSLEGATFSNVQMYLIIGKDGYVTEQWVSMDMTMTTPATEAAAEMEMKMSVDMTNTFVNPGQEVTITPPEDLDAYVLADDTGAIA